MTRLAVLGATCALAFSIPACETIENTYYPASETPTDIRLGTVDDRTLGIWVVESGVMIPDLDVGAEVTAFEFPRDGRRRVYLRDPSTGMVDRVRSFCVYDGERMVIDLAREPGLAFDTGRAVTFPTVVFGREGLTIADEAGNVAILSRRNSLPRRLDTPVLPVLTRFDGIPNPRGFDDMLVTYDGDLVYASGRDLIERFDPDTGTLLSPLDEVEQRFVKTVQPGPVETFWHVRYTGRNSVAFRSDLETVFDEVETDEFFELFLFAMTWHTGSDHLLVHGRNLDNGRNYLAEIDTDAEPDDLVVVRPFDRAVAGMAFDGTDLWILARLVTPVLCRVDPATAKVIESFDVPEEKDVYSRGITFRENGTMYLLGIDLTAPPGENAGVVLTIDPSTEFLP